jgi:hypothetical protein
MRISKYDVQVIGEKYNEKKEKYEGGYTLVRLNSDEGIDFKKLIPLVTELDEAHDGAEVEVSVVIKQRTYE